MKKIYRAPNKEKDFKKYWNIFLPRVTERTNFHESHLQQLEVLCNLYVDYHKLQDFIKENGYSFITSGRYGETSRPHIETQLITKVVAEIRAYTKLLGLVLDKDCTEMESNEWE